MKKLLLNTLITTVLGSFLIKGQVITKTDTINSTPLTIIMDKRVDEFLENLENNCINKNDKINSPNYKPIKVPNRELTTAEICRQTPKIRGYKIQLAIVKSNKEANEVKADFRSKFPSIKVETDASLRPNYKVLVGSYFTKQSSKSDLSKIREHFKSAIPVEYRIYCAEAK